MRALLVCDRSTLRSSGSHATFCAPPRLLARASAKNFTISDGLTKRLPALTWCVCQENGFKFSTSALNLTQFPCRSRFRTSGNLRSYSPLLNSNEMANADLSRL